MITRLPIVPAPPPPPPLRPMPGVGTRLTFSALGYSYSAGAGAGGRYLHPFKPALGGREVSLARGLVDVFEPVIGTEPISTGARLKLDPKVANERGESWVCVEVTPNADGLLDETSRVEIVHTATVRSFDPAIGREALALILWRSGRPWLAHAVVMFNLKYERVLPPPGGGPVRHLFR